MQDALGIPCGMQWVLKATVYLAVGCDLGVIRGIHIGSGRS